MKRPSTELTEYLVRQQKVREEIIALIEASAIIVTVDTTPEDRKQRMTEIADRWLTVIRAVCNVRPMVIEETGDDTAT